MVDDAEQRGVITPGKVLFLALAFLDCLGCQYVLEDGYMFLRHLMVAFFGHTI